MSSDRSPCFDVYEMDDLDRIVLHIYGELIVDGHDKYGAFSGEVRALIGILIVTLILRLIED